MPAVSNDEAKGKIPRWLGFAQTLYPDSPTARLTVGVSIGPGGVFAGVTRPEDLGHVRYSLFSLARNALSYHEKWTEAWRSPEPKPHYDVVIIGGGGHGLATAYYLAKEHGVTNVAVVEKGWLGGGNTGRNTTIIRSNYMLEPNAHFYEHSLKLWEGLSQDLNYNVMFSQRGVVNLAHSDPQIESFAQRGNAMRLNGIDAVMLSREEVQAMVPLLDCSPNPRHSHHGGSVSTTGWHRETRCGGLGAGSRSGFTWCRYHSELRGFRYPPGRQSGPRS